MVTGDVGSGDGGSVGARTSFDATDGVRADHRIVGVERRDGWSRPVRLVGLAVVAVGSVVANVWSWPNPPRWPATGWLGLALVPVLVALVGLSLWIEARLRRRRRPDDR